MSPRFRSFLPGASSRRGGAGSGAPALLEAAPGRGERVRLAEASRACLLETCGARGRFLAEPMLRLSTPDARCHPHLTAFVGGPASW